jgi:hypothetical protein
MAAQDRDLMPQDQDLHFLEVSLRASSASQENNRAISR